MRDKMSISIFARPFSYISHPDAYSEPCQTSKMEGFAKIHAFL